MNNIEKIINKINKNIVSREEINNVIDILKTGFLSRPSGGPIANKFQTLMSKKLGQKYSFAVTSGTAALHLAIASLELGRSDEVIVPALANIADCSVIIQEGAKPVFADIDSNTFNIRPEEIERKITSKTKAIIVVHMYGQPAEMDEIRKIADNNNLILIEDCAQAAGARYKKKYVGSFGDISCFSFYQTKHIIMGEGGMVLTKSDKLSKIIGSIANNGIKKDNVDAYDYDRVGYNYQMAEIQAALGVIQLKKLEKLNKIRRNNAKIYKAQFKNTDIIFQKVGDYTENAYFYLTGLLPERLMIKRDIFLSRVKKKGVPIKNLYPLSLPETELMKVRGNYECPVAQTITKRLFNLYVNPGLNKKDIINFSKIIKRVYQNLNDESK
jgi:perosamine synthetase